MTSVSKQADRSEAAHFALFFETHFYIYEALLLYGGMNKMNLQSGQIQVKHNLFEEAG